MFLAGAVGMLSVCKQTPEYGGDNNQRVAPGLRLHNVDQKTGIAVLFMPFGFLHNNSSANFSATHGAAAGLFSHRFAACLANIVTCCLPSLYIWVRF